MLSFRALLPSWAWRCHQLTAGSCRPGGKVVKTKLMRHGGARVARGILLLGLFLQLVLAGLTPACLSGSLPLAVGPTSSECCPHHLHNGSACPLKKTGQPQSPTHTCAFTCHPPYVLSLLSFGSLLFLPVQEHLPTPALLAFSLLIALFFTYSPGYRFPLFRPPMRLAR